MLRFEGVEIRQGAFRLTADFTVEPGRRVAVMGPSGAGKSTLLMGLAGFTPLAAGQITWDGQDMHRLTPGERPLSVLFQDQNLFPHLTVAQNVGLGLRPNLRLGADGWARVETALERVGLSGLADRKPGSLSGGQQSRVGLARVLLRRRPLLLLDEPFAALGPALKAEMLDLVREIASASGMTTLLVTHDPTDATRFAEATVVVADGQALQPRKTEDVLNEKGGPLAAYLGLD